MKDGSKTDSTELKEPSQNSISVVIPTYDMAWCIERAVASCLAQTNTPEEIIIVDDCSTDNTSKIVEQLIKHDAAIRYHRLPHNSGHLCALLHGLQASTTQWAALLDADDELVSDSLQRRTEAAHEYHSRTGEWPQLVYGDLYWEKIGPRRICHFREISGHDFQFLYRELSLCQTSTIMLGHKAIHRFPESANPYNTDDEIVLSVAKYFPILHCGAPVTITHAHESATRMTNSSRRRLKGIAQLVRDHRGEILSEHGVGRVLLWYLRVLRVFLDWQNEMARRVVQTGHTLTPIAKLSLPIFRLYALVTRRVHDKLTNFLEKHFEQIYF